MMLHDDNSYIVKKCTTKNRHYFAFLTYRMNTNTLLFMISVPYKEHTFVTYIQNCQLQYKPMHMAVAVISIIYKYDS